MHPNTISANSNHICDYTIVYNNETNEIVWFSDVPTSDYTSDNYTTILVSNTKIYEVATSAPQTYYLGDYVIQNGELVWTPPSEQILIDNKRPLILDSLRLVTENTIQNLPQNENKAKTLFLEWIENGSLGDKPTYWTEWKTARDIIADKYNTYKAYLNDEARTLEELENWEWVD